MFSKVVAASVLASAVANLSSAPQENIKLLFASFKERHSKTYANEAEELSRFKIFVENLKLIDERNAAERKAGGSATHGITRFADLTHEEFVGRYMGYVKASDNTTATDVEVPHYDTGSLVDWSTVYTTPVKDQGYCGSCWAFAASEQIESDAMRTLGKTWTLSPEQLVECDRTSMACNGGLQERAYNYVKRAGGIEQEKDYPYTSGDGESGSCASDSSKYVVTVTGYSTISNGESAMASYVQKTGPLSIAIDASTWSTYTGGVMSSCGTDINHAVQLVGVDTGASTPYWKVRNSWSADWGEAGYIRLAYGSDMCGITYDVTYTAVKAL